MARLADYVIDKIYEENAKHIFMVTGRGALFLTDAIAANKKIKPICVHHEQSAAYAAISYAQYNNEFGACLVSTGCASTNAITGVLNAWQDGIPSIFISGQNKLDETTNFTKKALRTYGQQEADIVALVQPITKYATMITDPNKIVYELEKAIYLAKNGRKGPVWIDIPLDIQNMRIDLTKQEHYIPEDMGNIIPNADDLEFLIKELNHAKRPVVLIGSGVSSSDSINELKKFINKTSLPVTYTSSAVDIFGLDNELCIGSVGIMGCSRAGNFAIQNSDLVLVLGSRLNSMIVGEKDHFAREAKVIVVDIDEVEHSKQSVNIDKLILSDIKEFFLHFEYNKLELSHEPWIEKCKYWKSFFPKCESQYTESKEIDLYYLSEVISNVLPSDASVITDSGLLELIIPNNTVFKNNQRAIHPISQGSMGYAIPAILGVHYSSNAPIVCLVGDGSIMMNLQELQTISSLNIPVKILVINNNMYSVIRKRQKQMFRNRTIGTDFTNGVDNPNFKDIAKAFNFEYKCIKETNELENGLVDVFNTEKAIICEIYGLENQDYISTGHAKNIHGKIVTRPIEDQSPYLDRELFLSEMLVTPINQ